MSIFDNQEHDQEFEYTLSRRKFIVVCGETPNGEWGVIQLKPRDEYKDEYKGCVIVPIYEVVGRLANELINIIPCLTDGYETMIREEVEKTFDREHVRSINILMKEINSGFYTTYHTATCWVVPDRLFEIMKVEIYNNVVRIMNTK